MSKSKEQPVSKEVGGAAQAKDGVAKDCVALSGSRIINLDKLQQYTSELNQHASSCDGSIILSGEV